MPQTAPGALAACLAVAIASCAGTGWPDEPGLPVAPSRAANLERADQFFETLGARRQAAGHSAPVPAARLQPAVEKVAEALQQGTLSAAAARAEVARVGRATYGRPVDSWVLDCAPGRDIDIPSALLDRPTAVVAYAVARFRPRSLAAEQCGALVAAVSGTDEVRLEAP